MGSLKDLKKLKTGEEFLMKIGDDVQLTYVGRSTVDVVTDPGSSTRRTRSTMQVFTASFKGSDEEFRLLFDFDFVSCDGFTCVIFACISFPCFAARNRSTGHVHL